MPFSATIQMIDSLNRVTTKRVETETDVLATAQAAVAALAPDLLGVSDLGIVKVTYSFEDDTEASAAGAGSNTDVGATFRCRLDNGKVLAYKIPGFDATKAIAGGSIPVDDADVVAFFENFEAAGAFTVSEGDVITEVLTGALDK